MKLNELENQQVNLINDKIYINIRIFLYNSFEGVINLVEDDKSIVRPESCISHDTEGYEIEVELPGVSKDKVNLKGTKRSICLSAPRDDLVYSICWSLAHPILIDSVDAEFKNGLLKIKAPLKESLKGKKIKIR